MKRLHRKLHSKVYQRDSICICSIDYSVCLYSNFNRIEDMLACISFTKKSGSIFFLHLEFIFWTDDQKNTLLAFYSKREMTMVISRSFILVYSLMNISTLTISCFDTHMCHICENLMRCFGCGVVFFDARSARNFIVNDRQRSSMGLSSGERVGSARTAMPWRVHNQLSSPVF